MYQHILFLEGTHVRLPRGRAALTAYAAVSSLALAACFVPWHSGPPSPLAVSVPPSGTSPAALVLPVERYLYSPAQVKFLDAVVYDEARGCMSALGFTLPALPIHDGTGTDGLVPTRYGPTDPATASRLGYHTPSATTSGATTAQPASTPDELAAYFGHNGGAGGCHGRAATYVAGAAQLAKSPVAEQIKDQGYTDSLKDPRVIQVFHAWSQCMKTSGYDYADPVSAYSDARWNSPTAGETEIKTAVADVACKRRTDLVGVWFAVESAYENARIPAQSAALAAELTAKNAEIRNATAYAASSGLAQTS